ncbi:MAG: hypothetical protein AB8I08_04185 [Sandaracinaceae bacterium]
MRLAPLLLVLLGLSVGCDGVASEIDGGSSFDDAGRSSDAGRLVDATPGSDGGSEVDAGTADAGGADAGGRDSGIVDGGAPDAGPMGPADPFDAIIPPGFPNSTNTGFVGPESALTRHESLTSTADGQVIENVFVTGTLNIHHDNVTVRNCRVLGGMFWGIDVRGQNVVIEDCEVGLEGQYAALTADANPGDEQIEVDQPVAVGAYVLLSSDSLEQQTLRVTSTSGSGPYVLGVERHFAVSNVPTTGPANLRTVHAAGAVVSIYDPATMPPIPGTGVRGAQQRYEMRRCDVHHVNDGFKMGYGIAEDNYVHELIYVPPAHLDSMQAVEGDAAIVRHNSLVISVDANGIQLAANTAPLTDLVFEYNFLSGGGYILRWGVDGGRVCHNRFGASTFGPMTVYTGGRFDAVCDNRLASDGSTIGTRTAPGLGDRDGDGTGSANAWGTGYDVAYALPGNL